MEGGEGPRIGYMAEGIAGNQQCVGEDCPRSRGIMVRPSAGERVAVRAGEAGVVLLKVHSGRKVAGEVTEAEIETINDILQRPTEHGIPKWFLNR